MNALETALTHLKQERDWKQKAVAHYNETTTTENVLDENISYRFLVGKLLEEEAKNKAYQNLLKMEKGIVALCE